MTDLDPAFGMPEVPDPPPGKRRGRTPKVPTGMTLAPGVQGSDRERLALWWKERIQNIEAESQRRIDLLRTVGEHPSPVFAKMVRNLGYLGLPLSLIAKMLGITQNTLKINYEDEYDLGAAELLSSVSANMARIATSTEDPNAAKVGMEILNRRGGDPWRLPAQKIEMKNENEAPPIIDSSKLTAEERAQLREMLTRIAEGGTGEPLQPDEDSGLTVDDGPGAE
jgi:hypothetical protein